MRCAPLVWAVAAAALVISACGSEVSFPADEASGGGAGIDPECYDACIAKGVSPQQCAEYCADDGIGGKGSSSSGKGGESTSSSSSSSGTSTSSSSSSTSGKPDPEVEKPCIECWYDQPSCAAEAQACDQSLACTQLQWCPVLCGKPDCIPECNDIIPTGVEPLTDLIDCAVCNGGPCADECEDSAMLSYCK